MITAYDEHPSHLLTQAIRDLLEQAINLEKDLHPAIATIPDNYQASARNLVHYQAMRQNDLRLVQQDLTALGLSSLGRSEAHVLPTIETALENVLRLNQTPYLNHQRRMQMEAGPQLLHQHTEALLGDQPSNRNVRIMVTMPSAAADEPQLIHHLLEAGMNVMRINCAHDSAPVWTKMVEHLRLAELKTGHSCKVYCDLAGPKLRTGPIQEERGCIKLKPKRNHRGQVTKPGEAWICTTSSSQKLPFPPEASWKVIPVSQNLLESCKPGDQIKLRDGRARARRLLIKERVQEGFRVEVQQTLYIDDQTPLKLTRDNFGVVATGQIGPLPPLVLPILLHIGDELELVPDQPDFRGYAAISDYEGKTITPTRISCTLAEVFAQAEVGHHIWFDDGKFGGIILHKTSQKLRVAITHAPANGAKLKPEKGINLPDTEFQTSALTEKDIDDLKIVTQLADMVGLSFVRHERDVELLIHHLQQLDANHLGIVLKIENRQAFENLPKLLLASLRSPPAGVMVARGDLAVEVGFERLAEVQDEILWFCEAAHVPVIWATQVLEGLAQKGMPTRAEVSDAAKSVQAECVMLNKGPNIVNTVRFLSDILERMEAHLSKKRAMLRRLAVSSSNKSIL